MWYIKLLVNDATPSVMAEPAILPRELQNNKDSPVEQQLVECCGTAHNI